MDKEIELELNDIEKATIAELQNRATAELTHLGHLYFAALEKASAVANVKNEILGTVQAKVKLAGYDPAKTVWQIEAGKVRIQTNAETAGSGGA